ncbi:MAG: BolA family transcriptional regulator [Gammaproteobacteria bacterium]|nr:BolA family transcriptional regulator [Gammaproteobacteria bacterium]
MDRVALIRTRLERALSPRYLEIIDESRLHAGHAGAAQGGHFAAVIVSEKFHGLSSLARHRLVYAALTDIMPGEVHALSIQALTPDEHRFPDKA